MNIFMNDTQKYTDLKKLVESSYTSEIEAKDVWKSIRWNLLTPDSSGIIEEHLDLYTPFLETGKPLCHLDFYVGRDEDDPFFDAVELPYVSMPCSEFTMGYISETKHHYRFFFVNPDVNGPEDFSFMNKLALKDTYIFVNYDRGETSDEQKYGLVPLNTKECNHIKFIVHCLVDSDNRHFRFCQMLEVKDFSTLEKDGKPFANFTTAPFENMEKDLQKRFNARMNRKFSLNRELQTQTPRIGIWKWSDIIKMYLF